MTQLTNQTDGQADGHFEEMGTGFSRPLPQGITRRTWLTTTAG